MTLKKFGFILGGLLLVCILLNPGIDRFKEYIGAISKDSRNIKRKYNFLVYSIYEDTYNNQKYVGFLQNFINITPAQQSISNENTDNITTSDTTTVITPSSSVPQFHEVKKGKVKMVFPDGSIGDIDYADVNNARVAGAKPFIIETVDSSFFESVDSIEINKNDKKDPLRILVKKKKSSKSN